MSDNPRILDRDDVTVEDLFDLGAALALRIGTLEAVVCMLINLELERRGMMPPPRTSRPSLRRCAALRTTSSTSRAVWKRPTPTWPS